MKHRQLLQSNRWIRWVARIIAGAFVVVGLGAGYGYHVYSKDLPPKDKLVNYQSDEATRIYDRNGELLYEVHGEKKRIVVPGSDLPNYLKDATVAIEDQRFYQHGGVDPTAIVRAAVKNAKAGGTVEGGSTITQQLVKNAYLSSERSVTRKIKEVLLAVKLEHYYSKQEILEWYLNEIGYGSNAYGAEAAAEMYFHKPVKELNLPESAMLAAMTKSPTELSPYGTHKEALLGRRNYVLDKMVALGYVSQKEADGAKMTQIAVYPRQQTIQAPHFAMYVKQLLIEKYGEDMVETGGLQVKTSLDLKKQRLGEAIVAQSNDVLAKSGASNAALVLLDPKTGEILTMVGSRDYFDTKHDGNVNVATSGRPAGSSFKPIVYAEAFNRGPWAPGSTIFDVETDFGSDTQAYIPKNYDQKTHGAVSLRTALANSYNIPAVKLTALVGVDNTVNVAQKLGITTLTDRKNYGYAIGIGAGNVQLVQLAGAYGAIANQGMFNGPVAITKVTQRDKTLFEFKPEPKLVYKPEAAYEVTSVLTDIKAREPIFGQVKTLSIPNHTVAVKTGTSQDYHDAWTVGYTPSYVVGVWVGNNNFAPMKEGSAGALAAAPIWQRFMTELLKNTPDENFTAPGSLKLVKVDAVTGQLPTTGTRETREDIFADWQAPSNVQLASVTVFGCDGVVKGRNSYYVVHSEKQDDPKWEKPVQDWARAHGYPTGARGAIHETCEPEPSPSPEPSPAPEPQVVDNPEPVNQPAVVPAPTPAPVMLEPVAVPTASSTDDSGKKRRDRKID